MNRPYYAENYFQNWESADIREAIEQNKKQKEQYKAQHEVGITFEDKYCYDTFIAHWRQAAELEKKGKAELVKRAHAGLRGIEFSMNKFKNDGTMMAALETGKAACLTEIEQYSK